MSSTIHTPGAVRETAAPDPTPLDPEQQLDPRSTPLDPQLEEQLDPRPVPPLFAPTDVTGWDPTEVADLLYMDEDVASSYVEDLARWQERQARQSGREAAEDVAAGDLAGLVEQQQQDDAERTDR